MCISLKVPGAVWFEVWVFQFSLAQHKPLLSLSAVLVPGADTALPSGCLGRQVLLLWQETHTDQFSQC